MGPRDRPSRSSPSPTAAVEFPVARVCADIVAWAADSADIDAISSTAGRAEVAAAMRRLEVRIGELLGDPRPGERTDLSFASDGLTPNERHYFRTMAAHADVVEDVIADSDDDHPATRRQVLDAISWRIDAQGSAQIPLTVTPSTYCRG